MKPEFPSTPLSIGGVLDGAFRLYRSTFSQCWYLTLLYVVPLIAWSLVHQNAMRTVLLSMGEEPAQRLAALAHAFLSPAYLATVIVMVLGIGLGYGCLIITQRRLAEGTPIAVPEALMAALRALPAAIAAQIIFGLVVGVSSLLLFIPGIFFYGKLYLYPVAVYADRQGPTTALGTSWNLTSGRWWRSMTLMVIAFVVYLVFNLASQFALTAVARYAPVGLTLQAPLAATAGGLGFIVSLPLFTAVLLAIYHDCQLRSQGGDLAARAAALSQAQA